MFHITHRTPPPGDFCWISQSALCWRADRRAAEFHFLQGLGAPTELPECKVPAAAGSRLTQLPQRQQFASPSQRVPRPGEMSDQLGPDPIFLASQRHGRRPGNTDSFPWGDFSCVHHCSLGNMVTLPQRWHEGWCRARVVVWGSCRALGGFKQSKGAEHSAQGLASPMVLAH